MPNCGEDRPSLANPTFYNGKIGVQMHFNREIMM